MYIGILTRNPNGWQSQELARAIVKFGHKYIMFSFKDIYVKISGKGEEIWIRDINALDTLSAILVRPIGRCSLEQAIYRMDILYTFEDYGIKVVNRASAIEKAIDKYRALHILLMHKIPVPPTIVCERASIARNLLRRELQTFKEGIVIKPMFGSRGFGVMKLSKTQLDYVWRIASDLEYFRHIIYIQKFIKHGGKDIRAFVIGDEVVSAMYRKAVGDWKTNISQGAKPIPIEKIPDELQDIAVRAAKALGCEVAGVDIIERDGQYYVLEVNSQPGWKGLQQVTKVNIAEKIVEYVIKSIKR